jgi:hypothetical protein
MKLLRLAPLAALVATALTPCVAHAHFIWATIEGGQVRFALLENPSQKPDARFGKYVAGLKSQLMLGDVTDGARLCTLPAGKKVALAESVVGVKNRDGVDYLLLYHARAATSLDAARESSSAPFEVLASRIGSELVVSVRQDGWPVPQAEVVLHLPGSEAARAATTDLAGETRFPFQGSKVAGFVGLRARVVEEKPGSAEGKKYTEIHHWTTLTFPIAPLLPESEEPLSKVLRVALGVHHDDAGRAAFNATLFAGKLTRAQLETHLKQRALIHGETDRILRAASPERLYGPAQKNILTLLSADLIALGTGWPTESEARPSTAAFLQEIRESEKRGPYFSLGVQHVYYGGITNGGRLIGQKISETVEFTSTYYAKSDGYRDYLRKIDTIRSPESREEMLRGGQAAYRYILVSSNEEVFQSRD